MTAAGGSQLLLARRANVGNESRIGSLVVLIIAPPFAETQVAIDCSSNDVSVAVILPVILPPADLAQFLRLRHGERFITTAKAPGRNRRSHPLSMR
jgi:hypothetical protein